MPKSFHLLKSISSVPFSFIELFFPQKSNLNNKSRSFNSGFSLIELLIVIGIASALIVLISGIPNSIKIVTSSNQQSVAKEIAAKQLESLRALPFVDLVNGETSINDSRLFTLPSGSGKVLIEDCSDPVCTNSEESKIVTALITWNDNGKNQEVKLVTLLSLGGLK